MILFWTISAGMIVLGITLLLPAVLRGGKESAGGEQESRNVAIARERLKELEIERDRGELDPASFAQARRELQLTLASELGGEGTSVPLQRGGKKSALVVVMLLVPILTVGLYQQLGAPQHLKVVGPGATQGNPHADAGSTTSVDDMVNALAQRLQSEPNNPDGWYMLGRSYLSMGRYPEAVRALEQLREHVGDHPTALVMLADAVAMTQSGRMSGRPAELVRKALEQKPDDVTALWLAGQAANEQADYAQAVAYWRRAEAGLGDNPQMLSELRNLIEQAQGSGGLSRADPDSGAPVVATEPSLDVTIELDPALAASTQPEDLLFVFARAVEGPPMPLAAARLKVSDLPVQITLDDSMAMLPQLKLSTVAQVKVAARISRSGQPTAQSGDLQSEDQIVDVAPGVKVALVIDRQVP